MIDLVCPKCQTKLPVPENKIGTRIFVCPQCATPLDGSTPAAPPPALMPSAASEDVTMAPDASHAYVQEKLRQIAEKRAKEKENAEPPRKAPPLAQPVKKAGVPIAILAVGGVAVLGLAVVVLTPLAALLFFRGKPTAPDVPQAHVAPDKPAEIKRNDIKAMSIDDLAKAVKDGPADGRKQAIKELGARGAEARPALAPVLDVMKDADAPTRTLAQETIVRMGPATKADVPLYAAALREPAPEMRAFAAGRLADLGQQAKSELVFLRVLMFDNNAVVQEAAQKAVLSIEGDLILSLTKGLKDPSPVVRSKAARELAEMGENAKAALPGLVDALADKNSAVRLAVLDAFVAIGSDAVLVLGESLRDKNLDVRLTAISAIGKMGSDARFVMPELIAVTLNADAKTKEEAMQAFARIGDYAIPYLIEALEREKNAAKQKPLIATLERMGPSAGPALQAALKKAPPEVAKVAAPALAKIDTQSKPPPPPKDHTGAAGSIQAELRAWFNATDTNKDGFLDKDELARAIRGPKAKAYDYTPDGKPAKQFGPKDFPKLPDYAFLCRVDRDNDGKVSRDEFERWAYDYAEVLKKDQEALDRIQQAQLRLQERGLSAAIRQQMEANLANLWAAYHNQRAAQNALYRDIDQMQWLQRWAMNRWTDYNNQMAAQGARNVSQLQWMQRHDVNQMQWLQRWAMNRVPPRK